MNMPIPKLRYPVPAAALLAAVLASSSVLHGQTWDGGGTTISWGTKENWVGDTLPSFNTSTDLIFNTTGKPDLNIGAARIIRSITFGADIDSDFVTNFRSFDGGAAASLTMQAATGSATLTVDAGATGNISYGWKATGTAGGALTLGSNLDIVHNGSGTLTFSRQIVGTGGFTKSGSGTMRVAQFNTNTFTGAANFNGGRAIFGNTNTAGGDLNTASAVNLGGGTLEILTTNALNKTLTPNTTVSAPSTLVFNNTTASSQTLALQTGTFALDASLTVQNISANTTLVNGISVNRNITGTGSLTVETYNNIITSADNFSLGRVSVSGDNSAWSGDINIAKGTFTLQGTSLTGQQTGTGILSIGTTADSFGAGLSYFSTAANATNFQINNNIVVNSGGFRSIKGGNTDHGLVISGGVTLNGDLNVDHTLSSVRSIAFTGNITGTGGLNITRSGGGTTSYASLTGTNDYSGGTTVATGARLSIGTGGSTGSITGNISNDGEVIFDRSNAYSYAGNISGAGALFKSGAGTLTLGGVVSSTGVTSVTAGSMIVDGSFSAGSNMVSVDSGAALGGDGSISGSISFASGANLIFNTTATLDVVGDVTFGGFSTSNLIGLSVATNAGTYKLLNSIGGTISQTNVVHIGLSNAVDLGGGKLAYLDFTGGDLSVIVGSAIPEPGSFALIGGMAAMGLAGLRRRRRSAE